MSARVFVLLTVHTFLSHCVTVNRPREAPGIISKSKVELTPILITSGLNDIVVLSAPILNDQAIYYLHRPNGDALRLNFKDNKDKKSVTNHIVTDKQVRIFKVNYNESCCEERDVVTNAEEAMAARDFMIGPLQDEDHGNWVLSAFFKDLDGNWIELFQVITMEIIKPVPLSPEKSQLDVGDTFALSFSYPIPDLDSCQIVPPPSTVDRFYDRTRAGIDRCEFIMNNVTLADEGSWTIIGVGRIVYNGSAFLNIRGAR